MKPGVWKRHRLNFGGASTPESKRFVDRRRLMGAERNPTYYAKNNQPNLSKFGTPDFVGSDGRLYRVAFESGHRLDVYRTHSGANSRYNQEALKTQPICVTSRGMIKLWVKLPKGVLWFGGRTVVAMDVKSDREATSAVVTVKEFYRRSRGRRTGDAWVVGLTQWTCNAILYRRWVSGVL